MSDKATHHVIAKSVFEFFSQQMEYIGVSVEDVANKLSLNVKEDIAISTGQAVHSGGHLKAYYEETAKSLSKISQYLAKNELSPQSISSARNAYDALQLEMRNGLLGLDALGNKLAGPNLQTNAFESLGQTRAEASAVIVEFFEKATWHTKLQIAEAPVTQGPSLLGSLKNLAAGASELFGKVAGVVAQSRVVTPAGALAEVLLSPGDFEQMAFDERVFFAAKWNTPSESGPGPGAHPKSSAPPSYRQSEILSMEQYSRSNPSKSGASASLSGNSSRQSGGRSPDERDASPKSGASRSTSGKTSGYSGSSQSTGGLSPDERSPSPKSGASRSTAGRVTKTTNPVGGRLGRIPILIDLDGNGLQITKLDDSGQFFDIGGDGYQHRSAWAGAGDGVLIFDADNDGKISSRKEVVLTDWDPSADSDMEALRQVFDTNGDGLFDAGDAQWLQFKVLVTRADGTTEMKTLGELGIQSLMLVTDETRYAFSDGSSIDGEATFTRTDGTTGKTATATLMIDANGYAVSTTETTDADGNRIVTTKALNKDGSVASETVRTTSPDRSTITTRFDNDGDGVTDRVLTDVTVHLAGGSKRRTETSASGAGVLLGTNVTETSADGSLVHIDRDERGGGFTTETELQQKAADGSLTITVSEKAANGTTISTRQTVFSADRLTRSDFTDLDGDLVFERSAASQTLRNADGSITKIDAIKDGNGNTLSSAIVDISADGLVRAEHRDLNGDGLVDRELSAVTTRDASGATAVREETHSRSGALLSKTLTVSSSDGLTKTVSTDVDGDGAYDRVVAETTVIGADQSRTQTVSTHSANGTLLSNIVTTRAVDGLTGTKSADVNGDGFVDQTTTIVRDVDGRIIETTRTFGAMGNERSKNVVTTSADGLSTITQLDHFGAGAYDEVQTDTLVKNVDGSVTQTVERRSGDNALLGHTTTTESANGLLVQTDGDLDGDGQVDRRMTDQTIVNADGSQNRSMEIRGQNGALLSRESLFTSGDRLQSERTVDTDGDAQINLRRSEQTLADGTFVVVERIFTDGGQLVSSTKSTTKANGLTTDVETDLDGNGTIDRHEAVKTILGLDGGKTITSSTLAGDGHLLAREVLTQNGNGLVSTKSRDLNGDGVVDETVLSEIGYAADGSVTTTTTRTSGSSNVGIEGVTVSGNGLSTTVLNDVNGDGTVDRRTTTTRQLRADGSQSEIQEIRASNGSLIAAIQTTTTADGRLEVSAVDRNGDGATDRDSTKTVLNDGSVQYVVTERGVAGAVASTMAVVASHNGLLTTKSVDDNGDGVVDRTDVLDKAVLQDGTVRITSSEFSGMSLLEERAVSTMSGNGLHSATVWSDANGVTRSAESHKSLNADGGSTLTQSFRKSDGSLESTSTVQESGDGNTSTVTCDIDGDGVVDQRITETVSDDGVTTTIFQDLRVDGSIAASKTVTTSANKLLVTTLFDGNGDSVAESRTISQAELSASGTTRSIVTRDVLVNGLWQLKETETVEASGNGMSEVVSWDVAGTGTEPLARSTMTTLLADGSRKTVRAFSSNTKRIEETTVSADGLTVSRRIDADGDGGFEQIASTVSVLNTDGSKTTTATYANANGALLSSSTKSVSKDGATILTTEASGVSGWTARTSEEHLTVRADDSTINERTVRSLAGQILEKATTTTSADGKKTWVEYDSNGDGKIDQRRERVLFADGRASSVETNFDAAGNVVSRTSVLDAANGLQTVTETDKNGDGIVDLRKTADLRANADGSRKTTTVVTVPATGNVKSRTEETVSADETLRIETTDINGDGVADQTVREERLASGASKTTITNNAAARASSEIRVGEIYWNDAIAASMETTVEADRSTRTIRMDNDGNGSYEVEAKAVTQIDGSVVTTITEKNADGSIKARGTLTQSHDQRVSVMTVDAQNDGKVDSKTTTVEAADGSIQKTLIKYDASGTVLETKTSRIDHLGNLLSSETVDGLNRRTEIYSRASDLTGVRTRYEATNGAVASVEILTEEGTIKSAVIHDALSKQSWIRVEQTYDTNGKKTLEKQFMDDGTRTEYAYDVATGGLKSAEVFGATGVRTATISYDFNSSAAWSSIETYVDAQGRTTSVSTTADNGARVVNYYDPANAQSWSLYVQSYNAAGNLVQIRQVNDSGTSLTVEYDVQSIASWSRIEAQYDSANRLNYQFFYYDNGMRAEITFDFNAVQTWAKVTNTFDSANRLQSQDIQYDDGSRMVTYTDTDGSRPFSHGVQSYAPNGNLIYDHAYTNGGGRSYKYFYDAYNNQNWSRKTEYYVSTALQYTEYWYDNGNYQKINTKPSNPGRDPVILDLDGDGLSGLTLLPDVLPESQVKFDWDEDGIADATAWVAPEDGLLVIDLAADGSSGADGIIDHAREIAFSMWPSDATENPVSDLEGLRLVFDSNGDNLLDAQDARWSEFRIWQDLNQNGVGDAGELRTMSEAGIRLLNLLPTTDGAMAFADGSAITGTSKFETVDGTTRLVADARFAFLPSRLENVA